MLSIFINKFTFIHLNILVFLATNGVGVNLLKIGAKRRRTKHEIQEEKDEELAKEQAIQEKLSMFEQMQQKITQLEESQVSNSNASTILRDLMNTGDIVQDGQGNLVVSELKYSHNDMQ